MALIAESGSSSRSRVSGTSVEAQTTFAERKLEVSHYFKILEPRDHGQLIVDLDFNMKATKMCCNIETLGDLPGGIPLAFELCLWVGAHVAHYPKEIIDQAYVTFLIIFKLLNVRAYSLARKRSQEYPEDW